MKYRTIDMDTYPRKEHFDYFRSLTNTAMGVTVEVDVTGLLAFCKQEKLSFFLTFLHAVALAADDVPEIRRRISNGQIVEYDHCGTSHTEPVGDGTFRYCALEHTLPFREYMEYAVIEQEKARNRIELQSAPDLESFYFASCVPWVHYTQVIQPTDGGDESNPRFTWGRYDKNPFGRITMPVSILCNHALVDGIHLGMFYDNLEKEMKAIINS